MEMRAKKQISILLVDDDEQFRTVAARRLEKMGFRVSCAATGEEALILVRNDALDVVILDVRLPDLDGNEVLRSMKMIRPDLPVIMLTGYGTMKSALLAMRDDVFEYLTKPVSSEVLAEVICNACEGISSPMCARWYNIWVGSEDKAGYLDN